MRRRKPKWQRKLQYRMRRLTFRWRWLGHMRVRLWMATCRLVGHLPPVEDDNISKMLDIGCDRCYCDTAKVNNGPQAEGQGRQA